MDSELVVTWKRTLEIKGFRRPAEYVPSAVASRSAEADHCKDGWKDARQKNEGKRKNNERNYQSSSGGRSSTRQGNTNRGGRGGRGRGRGGRGGRENNSEHLKNVECFNCGKKGHYSTDCSIPRKNDNEQSNMVSKSDFKNLFQSSLKEMLTKKDNKSKNKENAECDDESLDMNVFEKPMEGKHTKIVNKSNDDLKSINDTNTFDYSKQNKMTDKSCEDNNYNNDYD
jgi:hypothetical protein